MDAVRARALLGLRTGAGADAIEHAFRDLARAAHPDRGGDAVEFQALVEARNLLRRAAARTVVVVPDAPWWRQLSPLRARRSGDDERWAG